MSIGPTVEDTARWWCREIAGMIGLPRKAETVSPAFDIRVGEGGDGTPDEPDVEGARRPGSEVRLVLARKAVLKRFLGKNRLPGSLARRMAEIDLSSMTPIDPASVHILLPDDELDEACYFVVRRSTVAPLLDRVARSGEAIGRIAIEDGARLREVDAGSFRRVVSKSRRQSRYEALVACCLAGVFLLTAATLIHLHARYDFAIRQLDEEIAAAEISAKSAAATIKAFRSEQSRIDVLRSEKNATSFLQSWAEMTRAMPDGAWLTDFSLDGGAVAATGFAMSAASLIGQVERSGYFKRAEFTAPVVKSPGHDGERFTLRTWTVAP